MNTSASYHPHPRRRRGRRAAPGWQQVLARDHTGSYQPGRNRDDGAAGGDGRAGDGGGQDTAPEDAAVPLLSS